MKIKKIDNSYLDVKVINAKHSILINYELIENSAMNVISIDRGTQGDRYSCEFQFKGKESYIDEIINTIKDLRDNKQQIELSDFDENFFAENIDHTIPINCLVLKMDKQSSPNFNVYDITITFLADTNSLEFTGTPSLPLGMKCLQHKWEGYSIWNTNINETYYRNNFFIDSEKDTYVFKGDFILNNTTEMQDILAFHKNIRGASWSINSTTFGIDKMFGSEVTGTEHNVVILELDYERISPNYDRVSLTLRKVD